MRLERAWRFAVVVCFIAVTHGPALAAADYEALMREGVSLRRAGDDAAALKRFQRAYELDPTPRALAQIGLAEQALGRWAAADKHLRQALEPSDDAWIKKNRASIDAALAMVGGHVGQLEVRGAPAGAEVRVDGEVVGRLPLPRPITVTAGEVAVQVRAPGHLPIVRAATITARTLTRETFELQPLGQAAPGVGAAAEEHGSAPPADPFATEGVAPARAEGSAPARSEARSRQDPRTARSDPRAAARSGAESSWWRGAWRWRRPRSGPTSTGPGRTR